MSTTPQGIDQHTVPQVYLKQFAVDRNLLVYRPNSPMPFVPTLTPVKKVSTMPDFYTIELDDGTIDDAREHDLSRLENRYRTLIKRVRSTTPLTNEEHMQLSLLMATQEARSTSQRANWTDNMERLTTLAEQTYRHHLPDASEAELEERMQGFVRKQVIDANIVPTPENLARILPFGMVRDRYAILAYMHLCIVESRAQNFFTSDHPVCWVDPTDWPPAMIREYPSFRLSMEVTFPLTKRHCALLSWLPLVPRGEANEEIVHTINARAGAWTHRELYATPTNGVAERDRIKHDLVSTTDEVRRPLSICFLADDGDIRVIQAAAFLELPGDEIRRANQPLIQGWKEAGFRDIIFSDDAGAANPQPS